MQKLNDDIFLSVIEHYNYLSYCPYKDDLKRIDTWGMISSVKFETLILSDGSLSRKISTVNREEITHFGKVDIKLVNTMLKEALPKFKNDSNISGSYGKCVDYLYYITMTFKENGNTINYVITDVDSNYKLITKIIRASMDTEQEW